MPPSTCSRKLPSVRSSTVDIRRSVGSKRNSVATRVARGRSHVDVDAQPSRPRRSSADLGRVAARLARRAASRSAVLHAADVRPSSRARAVVARLAIGLRRRGRRSPRGVQTAAARIRFSVSVPVLSVQMTVVEPSVSTAREPLDERAPSARAARTPTARARVMVGSSPSGTLATMQPDREARRRRCSGSPARSPSGRKRKPDAHRDERDQPGDPPDLHARAGSPRRLDPLGERRDPPELGLHPRREHERPRLAPDAALVPLKTRSRASSSGPRRSDAARRAGQAATRRSASTDRHRAHPSSSRASAEIRSPLQRRSTSPGTSVARVDLAARCRPGGRSPARGRYGASASTPARPGCSWRTRRPR